MKDLIAIIVIAAILLLAIGYIVKAKKNGAKCIGCPSGGICCPSKKEDACTCGCGGTASDSCCGSDK